MKFQKNVTNNWKSKYNNLYKIDQLILRSNLLGSDLKVTNFGGGNTSSKITMKDPITKKNETILYVKGSGGDLGSIKKDGFASLYLDKFNNLKNIYRGFNHEDEMVGYYPMCTFNNNPRAASIDTPLHAYVPYPEVDHTHPDSIIALATMKNGRDIIKKVYGDSMGWLDWQRPGFDLGLKMENLINKNKNIIGIVLGHHGLFTWGNTNQKCYSNSIDLIKKAQTYLNSSIKKYSFGKPVYKKKSNPDFEVKLISTIRGNLSKENSKILHLDKSDITLEFVNSQNLKQVSAIGTSCPDHFLRTKRLPMVLPSLTELFKNENKIESVIQSYLNKYKDAYTKYYSRNKTKGSPSLRDPFPVIVLIPEYGMMSFAKNKSTARISSEFFCNAMNVMKGAEGISKYTGLTEKEAFRIEYWELEEAKLRRMPAEKELAGKVALITGAAGGIGSATAKKFLSEGSCVILTDIDKSALKIKHDEFSKEFGKDVVHSIIMDVTDEKDVKNAVSESINFFGGIDILVANAGFASAALFEKTSTKLWDKNMDILSKGCFLISREVYQNMMEQNNGGSIIFVSSKNSLNASKGASAYSVAKSSLLHLSRSIALEGSVYKIRSNVVNPDAVIQNSKIWQGDWTKQRAKSNKINVKEVEEFYKNRSLLKVSILPEDIAEGIYFFASSKSKKSTGNIINVDGGNITSFTR
ncbi:MAG: bifunctional rhamnulose-1-phosphate aldolase/short-chain dehydrogenase [Alphaproteobacteria bacterium]|nr:bifunctional rhamnulose-1-phosphate aldolase/short-chain dehydrogenase [Alphaproteobacteria bacterium]